MAKSNSDYSPCHNDLVLSNVPYSDRLLHVCKNLPLRQNKKYRENRQYFSDYRSQQAPDENSLHNNHYVHILTFSVPASAPVATLAVLHKAPHKARQVL
jgi:hypothetical protein